MEVQAEDKKILSAVCQYTVRGIMTSWMEEDGMLNGETLEQVLVRLDYLFKGAIREALMRSASREPGGFCQKAKCCKAKSAVNCEIKVKIVHIWVKCTNFVHLILFCLLSIRQKSI